MKTWLWHSFAFSQGQSSARVTVRTLQMQWQGQQQQCQETNQRWSIPKFNVDINFPCTEISISAVERGHKINPLLAYFSTSLFLFRIFMVLLSRPRKVKPYLQVETNLGVLERVSKKWLESVTLSFMPGALFYITATSSSLLTSWHPWPEPPHQARRQWTPWLPVERAARHQSAPGRPRCRSAHPGWPAPDPRAPSPGRCGRDTRRAETAPLSPDE